MSDRRDVFIVPNSPILTTTYCPGTVILMELQLYDTAEEAVNAARFGFNSLVNPEWVDAPYETSFIAVADAFKRLVAKHDSRKSPYLAIMDESKSYPPNLGETRRFSYDIDAIRGRGPKLANGWSGIHFAADPEPLRGGPGQNMGDWCY